MTYEILHLTNDFQRENVSEPHVHFACGKHQSLQINFSWVGVFKKGARKRVFYVNCSSLTDSLI